MDVSWAAWKILFICLWKLALLRINMDKIRKLPTNFAESVLYLISVMYVKEFMGFVQESAYEIRVNRLYFITTLPTI
jgi:hypothetical protein